MDSRRESREDEAAVLEDEIAEVCCILNVAGGRLVGLIGQVLDTEAWSGAGIRSPEQWVAWKCGVSAGRARRLVAMARRLPEMPHTRSALDAGEVAEDQAAVICHNAPTHLDAQAAELARSATVAQLRRTFNRKTFPPPGSEPEPDAAGRVSFGHDDDDRWRARIDLSTDEGELVERALGAQRQKLLSAGATEVTWADALLAVCESSLATEAIARPHYDRHLVVIHVEADDQGSPGAHVHLGPALPDSLRRFTTCDARAKVQFDAHGVPISVGRAARIVAGRTRLAVEERDGGCRVPGCDRTKWLHVHHIIHWEDGGATDTRGVPRSARSRSRSRAPTSTARRGGGGHPGRASPRLPGVHRPRRSELRRGRRRSRRLVRLTRFRSRTTTATRGRARPRPLRLRRRGCLAGSTGTLSPPGG